MRWSRTIHPGMDVFDVGDDKTGTVREISDSDAPAGDDASAMKVSIEPLDIDGQLYIPLSAVREISEDDAPAGDDAGAMKVSIEPLELGGQLYIPLSVVREVRAEGGGPTEPDRVLTVPEVAELLHVTPGTVRRWVRKSELQGCLLGGTNRGYAIRASAVARFLVARAARKQPAR